MSSSASSPHPDEELRAVQEREAAFRAQSAREFLELRKQLKLSAADVEQLTRKLGEAQTYIHRLHLAREEDALELRRCRADLETFVARLDRAESAAEQLAAIRKSPTWRALSPLRTLAKWLSRAQPAPRLHAPPAEPYSFDYHLQTSPYRVFGAGRFCLRGWIRARDGAKISDVRARVGTTLMTAAASPRVPEQTADRQPEDARSFEIELTLPSGRHLLAVEALADGREWRSFLVTRIWVDPVASP